MISLQSGQHKITKFVKSRRLDYRKTYASLMIRNSKENIAKYAFCRIFISPESKLNFNCRNPTNVVK